MYSLYTNSWGNCCNYQDEYIKHDFKITTRIKRICRIVECHLFTFSDMLNKMWKKVNTCVQILLTYFLHCDVYIVLISNQYSPNNYSWEHQSSFCSTTVRGNAGTTKLKCLDFTYFLAWGDCKPLLNYKLP